MTHSLFTRSRIVLFSLFTLLLSSNMYASHLVGADLYYTHVSGNTYQVTAVLYGDCGTASAASFSTLQVCQPQICVYNGNTYYAAINLSIDTPICGLEITPLCPGDTSQCTDMTSTIPGVKKFVYTGTVTLPATSHFWRFIYSGFNGSTAGTLSCGYSGSATPAVSGRAAAITNIDAASATILQLVDTLDNTTYSNSNPLLTVTQQTFFCLNNTNNYNPTPVDADGDSLVINLTGAVSGGGTSSCDSAGVPVTYSGNAWTGTPVSATTPLQCATDSFSMNTSTGAMSFFPNVNQRGVVVYNIDEYRDGATFVGTSQREMTVLVMTCTSAFPCITGTTTAINAIPTNAKNVEIFPDPVNDEFTIKMDDGAYSSYTISNNIGQVMVQQQLTASQTQVNVANWSAGVYYITFKGSYGIKTQKFVKW